MTLDKLSRSKTSVLLSMLLVGSSKTRTRITSYNVCYTKLLRFQYSTDNGTTWNDVSGPIDIDEGNTTLLVRTDTFDDSFDENNETFDLNATLTSLGDDYSASGTATIIDNDAPTVTVGDAEGAIQDIDVPEGT